MNILLKQLMAHHIDPRRNPEKVTYRRIRGFLHDTGYSHFFENITQIISNLTGEQPRRFTPKQKENLTMIFKEIQEPFDRHKGKRKNFLSYSYATYKSCELLGLDEFLCMLPLLKAPKNKIGADDIWQKICKDCGYQFIPTT